MKIKYSPCMFNEHANLGVNANTQITYVNENTINIDGEDYEFDTESALFPTVHTITDGVILDAMRINDVLHLVVRRFYTDDCSSWDTGEFHEVIA